MICANHAKQSAAAYAILTKVRFNGRIPRVLQNALNISVIGSLVMMNYLSYGMAAFCLMLCGCSSTETDQNAYLDRLKAYRQQCISDMDSTLSMPAGGGRFKKIRHGRVVENLVTYDVQNDFIFRGDVVLQIGSGDQSNSSDSVDVAIYAVSCGINIATGILQCDLSPAIKFKLDYVDGQIVCDNFTLIYPPESPLTCKKCVQPMKWFPFPRFDIEHRPPAPQYFSLIKPKHMKIAEDRNTLTLQYRFLLQIFSRENECLRQCINRTTMIRKSETNEFDFISQREFEGAFLKMLSNAEIVFEKDLLSI